MSAYEYKVRKMLNKKQNCIKVFFQGDLYTLTNVTSYKDVIKQMSERNETIKENQSRLVLYGDGDYIFEPATFNYYLILLPSPKTNFYLRLDNKSQCNKSVDNSSEHYLSSPVRRMNCFIGKYPQITGSYGQRMKTLIQVEQRKRELQVNTKCAVGERKSSHPYHKREQTTRCIRI